MISIAFELANIALSTSSTTKSYWYSWSVSVGEEMYTAIYREEAQLSSALGDCSINRANNTPQTIMKPSQALFHRHLVRALLVVATIVECATTIL